MCIYLVINVVVTVVVSHVIPRDNDHQRWKEGTDKWKAALNVTGCFGFDGIRCCLPVIHLTMSTNHITIGPEWSYYRELQWEFLGYVYNKGFAWCDVSIICHLLDKKYIYSLWSIRFRKEVKNLNDCIYMYMYTWTCANKMNVQGSDVHTVHV